MKKQNKFDKISNEELQLIINNSNSFSQILGKINLSKSCGYYRKLLSQRMESLDTSNFIKNQETTNKFAHNRKKYPLDKLFCENSSADIKTIKYRYISLYPQTECQICSLKCLWNNKILNLHLDHINGINSDNRLENLRWICPNCHSQTETYTGKNKLKK